MKTYRLLLGVCLATLFPAADRAAAAPTLAPAPSAVGTVVQAGSNVDLAVQVSGATGAVTVQWRKNGTDIPDAVTTPDANGIARYFLVNVQPSDGAVYSAVATDTTGPSAPMPVPPARFVVPQSGWQWFHPFPTPVGLIGVETVAGGDEFALLGARGYFSVSEDANVWEKEPTLTSQNMKGYVFGNGRHVVWADGFFASTTEGGEWETSHLAGFEVVNEVVFAEGLFVAVCSSGRIYTSPDAKTWTERLGSGEPVFEATYGNGIFVVSTATGQLRRSDDGITWTAPQNSPLAPNSVWLLRFANGKFFLGGGSGELYSSDDAIAWSADLVPDETSTTRFTDLAYANGRYVLVGGKDPVFPPNPPVPTNTEILTSDDGVTWTSRKTNINWINPPNQLGVTLTAVAYADPEDEDPGIWVAVGSKNVNGPNNSAILRSFDNGLTWTNGLGNIAAVNFNGAAYHQVDEDNASLVAVGDGGTVVRTEDGEMWTRITPNPTGGNLNAVTYTGGAYFLAGAGGAIRTSTDQGVTWSNPVTSGGTAENLMWIGALDGQLYVAGANGTLRASANNGVDWVARTTDTTAQLNGAAFGGGTYVAVGNGGAIIVSADGTDWDGATSGTAQNLNEVAYGAGTFVAVGDSGTILSSTNGTTWTARGFGLPENFLHVIHAEGVFVASGSASGVFVSPDGITWTPRVTASGVPLRATVAVDDGVVAVGGAGAIMFAPFTPEDASGPTSVSAVSGDPATFSLTPGPSILPFSYQWRRGGFDVPGQTGRVFTIPSVTMADAGVYDVVLTTAAGSLIQPALLTVAPTSEPGQLAPDLTYTSTANPLTISTRVYAALPLPGGKWLVGGDFVAWEDAPRAGLARLNADLTLDTGYVPPEFNGFVHALALAPDGSVYVGGEFTAVDGHLRPGLARLTSGLGLDVAWTPQDNPPPSLVTALAVQADGKPLVARTGFAPGLITGTNVLRRLNTNGSLDGTFSVAIAVNPGQRLYDVIVEPSGSIVFGGVFNAVNGTNRLGLARVDATGATLDTNFAGTGTNNAVNSLTRLSDGRYLVGGAFTTINGLNRNRLALIDTNGAVNTSFVPASTGTTNGNVFGAAVLPDGSILAGGNFNSFAGTSTFGLIRLTATGAVDQAYTAGGPATGLNTSTAGRSLAIFPLGGDNAALFGIFQAVLNARRVGVAVLDAEAGTLASTPASLAWRPAYSSNLFVEPDGQVTFFGSVEAAGGETGLGSVIRFNDDGSLDETFPGGAGLGLNGLSTFGVYRAVRQGDGKYVAIGDFVSYNGDPVSRLVRINPDGSRDTTFNPGTGPSNFVAPLLALSGGKTLLYGFGGGFTYNGSPANGLLRLNPDGSRDTTLVTGLGFTLDNTAQVINPTVVFEFPGSPENDDAGGDLFVAGGFVKYNGNPVPNFIRLNADGSRDFAFNSSGTGGSGLITGITIFPDGQLLLYGSFTSYNGAPANRMVLIDPDDGWVDDRFVASPAIDGAVGQVLLQADGKLIVTGDFSGGPALRLLPSGEVDPTFGLNGITGLPGGNGSALRLAIGDDGSIYTYNIPVSVNYGPALGVVRFHAAELPPPSIAAQPLPRTAAPGQSATFTVAAGGTGPFSYQWQKDGANLPGATGATLTIDNVSPANAGAYRAIVTNAGGSVATESAVLAVNGAAKVTGAAVEVASNFLHPNSNTYDEMLLTGTSATVRADPGQFTRVSFIDLNDDLVTVEFGGAGSITILLEDSSGPAAAANYNQPGVLYMKGRARLVVAGADETTNIAVFTVGTLTALNPAIFKDGVTYDGVADIASLAISSPSGKFGAVRTGNARYSAGAGLVGIYAPGVRFSGPVLVTDIDAQGMGLPVLLFGAVATDVLIAGGDLQQSNAHPILISGFAAPVFAAGVNSHGVTLPQLTNQGVLMSHVVPIPPSIASPNHATFTVGQAGSFTVAAFGSPVPTLSLTGTLPTGLTFNAATGVISGTPASTAGSPFTVTVTASNGVGLAAEQALTLTVNAAPPPTITGISPSPAVAGTPVTISGTNLGAVTSLTFNGAIATFTYNAGAGTISTTVPNNARSGPVVATAPDGASPGFAFTVPLTITSQPQHVLVQDGLSASVAVTVSGGAPGNYSYQWYKNGAPLGSPFSLPQSTMTFYLPNVSPAQDGVYHVAVTAGTNTVNSLPALVGVEEDMGPWLWRNRQPYGGDLLGVAYGAGRYVAVGVGGAVVTSIDGTNWTLEAQPAGVVWRQIAFNGSLFLAVGNNGNLARSADGVEWEPGTVGQPALLFDVAHGHGKWVAVGTGGSVFTSANATDWTRATIPGLSTQINGVAATASGFIAVTNAGQVLTTDTNATAWNVTAPAAIDGRWLEDAAESGGTYVITARERVYVSTNGTTWAEATLPTADPGIDWNRIVVNGSGVFIAAGASYPSTSATPKGYIIQSANGTDWTLKTVPGSPGFEGIAHGANGYVAVGVVGQITTSADGDTWVSRTAGFALPGDLLAGATGPNGTIFAGSNGEVYRSANHSDGWTKLNVGGTTHHLNAATYGNGRYVLVGGNGTSASTILSSTSGDSASWTAGTLPDSPAFLSAVTYDPGIDRFVAAGAGNSIYHATDPAGTWTAASKPVTQAVRAAAAGNGSYVLVGEGGKVLRSNNGTAWTEAASGTTVDLTAVAFGGGRFVAGGFNSNPATRRTVFVVSTDGGATWQTSAQPLPFTGPILGITFADGRFVAVGGSSSVYISTDGLDWEVTFSQFAGTFRSMVRTPAGYLAAGTNGAIAAVPAPTLTQAVASVGAVLGAPLSAVVPVTASGGTPPYTFSITPALPTGLVFNPETGQLTGTPTQAAAATVYTVTVTDDTGTASSATFTLTVATPVLATITGISPSPAVAGTAVTISGANLAGATSVTFGGVSATFTYNAGTGTISATVPANARSGNVVVTTPDGASPGFAFTVPLTITSQPQHVLVQDGLSTSLAVTVSGGAPGNYSYQWYKNGAPLGSPFSLPQSTMTFYLPNVNLGQDGVYSVAVTSGANTVTSLPALVGVEEDMGPWQWRNRRPYGGDLFGVAHGAGRYVAVGAAGALVTSTDGTNWTLEVQPAGVVWRQVAFNGSLFLAVGNNGNLARSADGVEWEPGTVGQPALLFDVAHGHGKWVAVGTGGSVFTSANATDWTRATIPGLSTQINGVAATASGFIAVTNAGQVLTTDTNATAWNVTAPAAIDGRWLEDAAESGGTYVITARERVYVSMNGTTWAEATLPTADPGIDWNRIVVNGGVFTVAGASYPTTSDTPKGYIIQSANGTDWTLKTVPGSPGFEGIAHGANGYVAVGVVGQITTSADGDTWVSRTAGFALPGDLLAGATGPNGTIFAGSNGEVYRSTNHIDGWTKLNVGGTTHHLNAATSANGRYVLVGGNGTSASTILSSTSGDSGSWTAGTLPDSPAFLSAVAYEPGIGRFVAAGAGNSIYHATDPAGTWTAASKPVTQAMRAAAAGNGSYVLVGEGGKIVRSSNGTAWTEAASGTTVDLTAVAFGGGRFVAGGFNSNPATRRTVFVVSTDGGATWQTSAQPLPFTGPIFGITFADGRFVAVGGSSSVYTSVDGLEWEVGFSQFANLFRTIVRTPAGYLAAGTSGAISAVPAPTATTAVATVNATVGVALAPVTPVTASGGRPPYLFAVNPALPAGLTLDPETGALSGTPTAAAAAKVHTVIVRDDTGTTHVAAFTLTVFSASPTITSHPSSVTIPTGGNATFSVVAVGNPAPTYQWRRNGLNIPGATGPTLNLTNVPFNGGGTITVLVSNAAGAVVSNPAQLLVEPPIPVITSPLSVRGIVNSPFTYLIGINPTVATFAATGLPAGLSVNPSTGVISGTPTAIGTSNVTISATNATGSDTETLQIVIDPPPPVITSPISASGRVGASFTYTVVATNSPTAYAAENLPPGLSINPSTGVISGNPTQTGTFTASVSATNTSGTIVRPLTLTIAPALNAPVYSGPTSLGLVQNAATPFSFTPVFANGVVTYALVDLPGTAGVDESALPAGLSFAPGTGTISGIATQVGQFPVALRATNAGGMTTVLLTLTVNPAPTAPVVTSASTATATVGQSFTFALSTNVTATSFGSVGLPVNGLSLNPATGQISGTPTAAGIHEIVTFASNAAGRGPNAILVITVNPSPDAPVITSAPAVEGRVGVATNTAAPLYQLAATNSPSSFAITSGTLPAGLQLEAATGKIFGTPTAAGNAVVWFAASHPTHGTGPALGVLFTIRPPLTVPVVTSNGTAAGQAGQPFSYVITGTNSPTGYGAANLPAWLSHSGPLLSGIPTGATTEPIAITVTASNGDGTSAPKTVLIRIFPAPATPVITSPANVAGRVGLEFSYQATASEGASSFAALNLPPGLEIDSASGLIGGTPTQAGVFAALLSAGNAAGQGNSSPVVFNIAPAPAAPAITSAASASGKVGVAFNYTTVATPGPITGYAITGNLPLGLGFNTSTGIISGIPAASGLHLVELTATSANGTSLPQTLLLAINPADSVPVITSPIFAVATVGEVLTYQITATNMPAAPFPPAVMLDAVFLPEGLAVNPSTGLIQGRPTAVGTYNAMLVGANLAGVGPFRSLTIFVQPAAAAPVVTSGASAAGRVGVAFSYQITASNSPQSFEVIGAPAWMTINSQTGALGGTPTGPGPFTVQLVASNTAGASNPATLNVSIAPAANTPVITSSQTARGTIGGAFSYTITASNAPTSFVATGLPAGLTLNSATGVISGAPMASGIFTVSIAARNANGVGQSVTLTLDIRPFRQLIPL